MTFSKLDDSAINGSGYAVTTVRLERGIVIRTLRITLLSDSGYALTGYEY
ncbi:TPA: hypothetical protein MFM05_000540 [Klebsiella pneumoniae]|nr:hypothetical protein [Klebsiella pneumoniae]